MFIIKITGYTNIVWWCTVRVLCDTSYCTYNILWMGAECRWFIWRRDCAEKNSRQSLGTSINIFDFHSSVYYNTLTVLTVTRFRFIKCRILFLRNGRYGIILFCLIQRTMYYLKKIFFSRFLFMLWLCRLIFTTSQKWNDINTRKGYVRVLYAI